MVDLPVAFVPLWHEEQVPVTCEWSTRVAGRQLVVLWQLWHCVVVVMCVAFLPVAVVPLWHEAQLPVTWV